MIFLSRRDLQCQDTSKMVASGSLAGEECGGEVEVKRRMTHLEEEDICISGIAGDFPDSDGVQELGEHLFNKVDLISDDDRRWKLDHPEIPQRTGKLKTVNKFDAASFGIHYNQAQAMDPMLRILLEKSYEAIVDSGNNPYSMRGSKTGVFIGACFSESEKTWFYEKLQVDGFGITGCIRTMLANRISYAFGLDGPSYVVDTACSSSMYALEQGYNAIREGHCEAAIVGGCNLCLHPYVSLQFARLGVLSFDGRCKVFDEAANGYCRSEAIAVCFLQKKKNSKRIYATLVHAKTNCDGYKEQGITYPSGEMQQRLLEEFYEECGINPSTLAWIEAHGTGTKVGDPEEVRALYNVFCKNRTTPLKIGSVKSNLGHTEPTSGMCSIAKVIIAMENLKIPPNINFKTPRSDIEYFHTGEIEVVTEPTPWDGGLVGVNSFGFGGANCHALLKWNEKTKVNGGLPEDDLPRLVNVSGRTEEAVDTLLKHMEMNILDKEFVRLIHSIYKDEVPSHLYRGYSILTKNKSVNLRDIQYFGMRQPLYVQFSGHCNKWKSFDKGLLQFPVFKQSLAKLSNVISHDLVNLVTNPTNIMSDPVEFIVAVVASQIALYNLLKHIGVEADGYIGISFGNLAVAYADGVLSAEDAIGIAYNLANILVESSNRAGGVFEKNHQGGETKRLSQKLLSSCKPKIIDVLKKTIKNGVSPSSKWLTNGAEKDSGAEFFYQSIVSTMNLKVDDEELPEEFILLNVGPKGSYDHMPEMETRELLDNSEGGDDVTAFLVGVGKLYQGGIESDLAKLYPEVEYPVSRATPMIAPLVRWNHTDDWFVTSYKLQKKIGAGERTISISLTEDESEYISGHVVDGRNLFPATGYLSLVWETVGLIKGEHYTEVPIVFEDVRFLRATNMSKDGSVDFTVIVQRASGNFEVVEGGAPIVTGRAYVPDDIDAEMSLFDAPIHCDKEMPMKTKDIYKELRLRGYNYKGLFRSMMGANPNENVGVVRWQKNWVAFMDNMLQMQILQVDTRGLFVPTSIDKVVIDGRKHVQAILSFPEEEDKDLAVYYFKEAGLIKSGGIEIRGPRANAISRKKNLAEAILEKYLFVPNNTESEIFNLEEIVRVYAQIILENENSINVKACELYDKDHTMLAPLVALVLSELPLIQPEILVLGTPVIPEDDPLPPEVKVEDKKLNTDQTLLMVAGNNILHPSQSEVFESCLNAIKPGGYIVAREKLDVEFQSNKVTILCSHVFNNERVMLLRKMAPVENIPTEVFHAAQNEFSWIPPSQTALKSKEVKRVIFYNLDGKNSGTLGFVNCVRKEPDGQKARCVLSMDTNVPQFEINHPFYKSQLSLDLAVNVYENGQWGTYRHLKMDAANKVKSYHIYANNLVRGDLSSLSWIKGTIPNESCVNPGEQDICYNCYSALNFRDIMLASGKLAPETIIKQRALQECVIGFEFSGYTSDGRRIMGMITSAGLASIVAYDRHLSWEIPDEWTLEEAATVPVTYGTALFALVMRGKMKKGDSVLIHAGTGGVGQAAINLAVAMGCEVFTTVGTPEKRQFIKDTWPQIDDRHIGNSRDTSFEQMVMHETNGRGVDLVLNSLAEEKLLASVRCLAKGGRFLEIGKFDLANNNPLGMEIFAKGGSFHGILLDTFFDAEPQAKSIIREILKEYIEKGLVKPLCSKVFKHEEIENAFRFMASGKHIGKVLIHMRDESDVRDPSKLIPFDAIPRFYCKLDYTYIVIGGLGGFGLELADWLVMRGCNRLVLTSRKGVSNGYQSYRIGLWRSYGVQVEVLTDDITTYEGVEQVLLKSEAMGPVGGIFNLAVVLKDAIYENQNEESFLTSLGPKAVATKHLDELSRKLCPQLDQFVVFSSVSCGRGNGGQTNYGMANSVMERICEKRAADGLPGIAIQWGAVGDVGLVAEMMEDHVEIVIGGTLQQRISSCLEVMDQFLNQNHPIVASMVVAEKKSGRSSSGNIVDTVVNILGIRDLKTVSFHSNLAELGMDSMMAVEIKQTLEREFEVFLSPQDIRGMTIAKLQEIAAAREAPQEDKAAPDGEIQSNPLAVDDYLIQVIAPEPEKYEPVTKMETLASNSTEKKTRLIVVPGLEGFPIVFEKMVKKMDLEVYGVTMDYRSTTQQISEVVDSLLPAVLSHLEDKTFNIFGYSYGGLISMELVRRLELQGYSGKLIILDSSPEMMQQYSKSIFADKIDDNLQVQTLLRILHNSLRVTVKPEVEDLLREAPDWDGRVEMITSIAKNAAPFSETYMKQLFNSGYGRVLSIFNLQEFPEKCISSPVTLIRPTELVCQISEDYGLSKYCVQPVPVHFVEGNHFTAVSNPKTREIVTETLTGGTLISSKAPAVSPPTEIQVVRDTEKQI